MKKEKLFTEITERHADIVSPQEHDVWLSAMDDAEREIARLNAQIIFERGLIAEATGAAFYPAERKTDLDVILSQVRFMRDNQAKVTLQRDRLQALLHEVVNQYYLSRTADHMTEATSLDIAAQIATKVEEIMK